MFNDLFLAGRIKEGDIDAFEKVFRNYYSPLCFFTAGITGRMDIAEEIVQELFYVLWKDRESIHIFKSLKGYLYRSARNRALQYHEHKSIQLKHQENMLVSKTEESESDSNPEQQMEYNELERIINETLKKMPERRRNIFRMHRFEKRKYSEIAESLSVSIKTVESEMTKALYSLRIEIEHYTTH